jgi:hypothetical protein
MFLQMFFDLRHILLRSVAQYSVKSKNYGTPRLKLLRSGVRASFKSLGVVSELVCATSMT